METLMLLKSNRLYQIQFCLFHTISRPTGVIKLIGSVLLIQACLSTMEWVSLVDCGSLPAIYPMDWCDKWMPATSLCRRQAVSFQHQLLIYYTEFYHDIFSSNLISFSWSNTAYVTELRSQYSLTIEANKLRGGSYKLSMIKSQPSQEYSIWRSWVSMLIKTSFATLNLM